MTVTGSRIKRIDAEGTTPLTINCEDIEQSGVVSTELFRKSALSSPIATSLIFLLIASGSQTINLLGLGKPNFGIPNGKPAPFLQTAASTQLTLTTFQLD